MPLLVHSMGEPVDVAIGPALAIVVSNALVGFLRHWRKHRADVGTGFWFGLAGVMGAVAGTWFGHLLPGGQILFFLSLLVRNHPSFSILGWVGRHLCAWSV